MRRITPLILKDLKKKSDENPLLIFDEIHKHKKWKTLVKGYYDTEKDKHQFIVTGSARLDLYQKGGDSLLGRYHYWRVRHCRLLTHPINHFR